MAVTDWVLIGQTLRTFPLTVDERDDLVTRFVDAYAGTEGFDPEKFWHEATRGPRPGEAPTYTLPDYWLRVRPEDVEDHVDSRDNLDADTRKAVLALDVPIVLAAHAAAGAELVNTAAALAQRYLDRVTEELVAEVEDARGRRSRTPGAWALNDNDPNAPYGPFPDEAARDGKTVARAYLREHDLPIEDYRIVFRKG